MPPLLGFCAYASGVGKTTLLTQLIPALTQLGIRVSVIKHAHHGFDIDHAGKDSYRLRHAGAVQTMLGSGERWALVTELARTPHASVEPDLSMLLAQMDLGLCDLVVVEGFRHAAIAKIELHRVELHHPLLAHSDSSIFAIASNAPVASDLPQLNLNNISQIADFVVAWLAQYA